MCQELISQSLETISRLLPRCLKTSRLVPRPKRKGVLKDESVLHKPPAGWEDRG